MTRERARHCLDCRRAWQHADLNRRDREIGKHCIDLRGYEPRRHFVNSADTLGILRGQGRDHRGAVDAKRCKGLQIGLDAGAAARIRTCDGKRDRGHDVSRRLSAYSTTERNSRADRGLSTARKAWTSSTRTRVSKFLWRNCTSVAASATHAARSIKIRPPAMAGTVKA